MLRSIMAGETGQCSLMTGKGPGEGSKNLTRHSQKEKFSSRISKDRLVPNQLQKSNHQNPNLKKTFQSTKRASNS
jgi:hypothetical protein